MKTTASRNFGVADGLILVAATAVGLAASRAIAPDVTLKAVWNQVSTPPSDGWSVLFVAANFAELGSALMVPSLAAWTVACLLMHLRAPRPARRRFVRWPGAMACLVATAVIGLSVAAGFAAWATTDPDEGHRTQRLFAALIFGSLQVGTAVLWCWITLALGGRWRPEPTWLDRLGRFLGATWVAVAALEGYAAVTLWPF